jgi:hypothetical protein
MDGFWSNLVGFFFFWFDCVQCVNLENLGAFE